MNLLDEVAKDERGRDRQQLLVWPPGVFAGHVDVLGSFTQPPWGRPLALHLCPETGVWWLAVEEALPGLQPGTYEFKFRRNGQDWAVNPALPVRRTSEGAQNNTLVIDRRLMARIERRAGQAPAAAPPRGPVGAAAQLPSAPPPAACRGVALAEEGSDAAGPASGRPDDHSADLRLAPRRAVSTAERLWNGGDDGGGPGTPDWQQRTASMPRLANGGCRGSLPLDVLGGLSGVSEEEGDLYGTDVSLLLELPDVKRCTGLALVAGAFNRPKDGTVGEDAYFLELPFLGVADGVGGMQHVLGHSSKAFAEALMSRCREFSCEFAAAAATGSLSALGPGRAARQVLCEGYREVQVHGASTAVISWLDSRTNKLGVAVLGDSGVMVVRRPTSRLSEAAEGRVHSTRSSVVFKSPSQQHDFNYPYQLCRLPAAFRRLQLRGPDKPTDCAVFEVDVEEGDLILCYSDGVDDNLYDQEILDICDRALSPYAAHVLGLPDRDATPPELVSRAVGAAAYTRSRDQKARVPFADAARKAGWPTAWCRGGKEDDITCLAAWVQHQPTGAQATPGRGA
ncbi:unnamed protein product [Prorocentrum cordatum]|nr:unnamed protein product [Polarella glacialis]